MKTSTKVFLVVIFLLIVAGLVWLGMYIRNSQKVEVNGPSIETNDANVSDSGNNKVGTSESLKPEELLPNEFEATIERREGNTLFVSPFDATLEVNVAEEIGIVIDGKEIDIDEFAVGDKVKIAYFDGITKTGENYLINGAQWIAKISEEN